MAISRKWWEPPAEDSSIEDEPGAMTRHLDIDDLMILSLHGFEIDIAEYTRCRSHDLRRDVRPRGAGVRFGPAAKQAISLCLRALRYFCREPGGIR